MGIFSLVKPKSTKTIQDLEVKIRIQEAKKEKDPTWKALADTKIELDKATTTYNRAVEKKDVAATNHQSALDARGDLSKTNFFSPAINFLRWLVGYSKTYYNFRVDETKLLLQNARDDVKTAREVTMLLRSSLNALDIKAGNTPIAKEVKKLQEEKNQIQTSCENFRVRINRIPAGPHEADVRVALLNFLKDNTENNRVCLEGALHRVNYVQPDKSNAIIRTLKGSSNMVLGKNHDDTIGQVVKETIRLFSEILDSEHNNTDTSNEVTETQNEGYHILI